MHNTPVETLIATARAAEILRCGPENVRRLARAGQLPIAAIIGRGERLYALAEVEALARLRRQSHVTDPVEEFV